PELPAIELSPAGPPPLSPCDFSRELLLHLFREKQVPVRSRTPGDSPRPPAKASLARCGGEAQAWFKNEIFPIDFHELVEKVAGRLVYGEQGIARREGNVPQLDCWKTVLPLLAQEIAGHKFGRMILHQLKRLKKGQWCEQKTLEETVAEYGLLEKPPEVEGYFASVLLPSGFGQKALHQGRHYYRLAPEIFSYLTEGLLPEFPEDEADSFELRGEAIAFRCSWANPATLWRMSFIGRGTLEGEWLTFALDRIRLARLQKAGIDPAPLFEALKEILPPAFLRQYAAFRAELGKNTLYFHYTPIQIQDETLALFLQRQLPELIPLGDQFYLLASEEIERLQALLKKNNYVARVVACHEGGAR
ncbi:MAG: hypothetical protein HYY20_10945, partial [Candidatus Tectomicrobia bacterium]|nr:hypothetical protein [Candidatus Tectomicrobia bacterium]